MSDAVTTNYGSGDVSDPATAEALWPALEAVLLVADQPVPSDVLAGLFSTTVQAIDDSCARLASRYEAEARGLIVVRIAGGWRFQTHPDQASAVERFLLADSSGRLSRAALETLAIVAYKQPISRTQVAMIRGVNTDATVRTLMQRGYVAEIAIDPGPGQAALFGTTPKFLESMGLDSLAQLPELGDLVPPPDVMEALEASLRVDGEGHVRRRSAGSTVVEANASAVSEMGGPDGAD